MMEIGSKIFELRKKNNLSQEKLAELVGVARQTISKWELGETSPDIKQAKQLAEIFHVSLDELAGNDVKEVLIEKVSNTEKLAGMVIKILKVLGVVIVASFILTIAAFVGFTGVAINTPLAHEKAIIQIEETLGEETCYIEVGDDGTFSCSGLSEEMEDEILELVDFDDLDQTYDNIRKYFIKVRDDIE